MSEKSGTEKKVMSRKVIYTADGSTSILIPDMNEMYHSRKGAVIESKHVYIDNGISLVKSKELNVLEIGMGTGLNVFLACLYGEENGLTINFETLEPYPLSEHEWSQLNFHEILPISQDTVVKCHSSNSSEKTQINERFSLLKYTVLLEEFETNSVYDIILFDAFAPNKQASPWSIKNIQKAYQILKPKGILTTYCAQGQFKRDLKSAGFKVTNPEGPLGKREITVAYK